MATLVINTPSRGKGHTAQNPVNKMATDGRSGAFLCSLRGDNKDLKIDWPTTTERGEVPGRMSRAVEIWFSTLVDFAGKDVSDIAESQYGKVLARVEKALKSGGRFALEFTPTTVRVSPIVMGADGNVGYTTATVGIDAFAARRFFELQPEEPQGI